MARNGDKPSRLAGLDRRDAPIWSRLDQARRRLRPVTMAWIVNVFTALCIIVISSYPRAEKVQNIIFKPPGSEWAIVQRDLEIPKDVEVPNFKAMAKEKEDARSSVRTVYDWDPDVGSQVKSRLADLFNGLRELNPQPRPMAGGTGDSPLPEQDSSSDLRDTKEKLLLAAFIDPVDEEDLAVFKEKNFSPEIERAINDLLDSVYIQTGAPAYVVASRELLLKDRGKGITAYPLSGAAGQSPVKIDNLDGIRDVEAARKSIEEKAKDRLKDAEPKVRKSVVRFSQALVEANLFLNKTKTEAAKDEAVAKVKTSFVRFYRGEVPYRRGERVDDPFEVQTLEALIGQLRDKPTNRLFEYGGTLFIFLLFFASIVTFGKVNVRKFKLLPKDIVFLSLNLLLAVGMIKGVELLGRSVMENFQNPPPGLNFHYLVPVAASAMLVRMVLNSEIAMFYAVAASGMGAFIADGGILFFIYSTIGSVIAAGEVRQCRQRSTILRAGLILGTVNMLLVLVLSFINLQVLMESSHLINAFMALIGGVVSSIVITGLVPVAEFLFTYASDIKLLELLNQDHPILKDLSMRAPGTHQHALMVGNLAEAAAKAIGANPLLARVIGMYHDVGKMNKPPYYAENQWDGVNVHDRLSPSMSTLIIHNHVKDGVELAVKHKLPQPVIDGIEQHHGTALVHFFYEKAKEMDDTGVPVEESEFRYPGPKPQNRESAIIMLADQVESAARSLRDPNASRLQGMVQRLINRAFTDGQLDECELTLKNLYEIANSFQHTLGAIYHHRPDYPAPMLKGPADKKKKAESDAGKPKDSGGENKGQPEKREEGGPAPIRSLKV